VKSLIWFLGRVALIASLAIVVGGMSARANTITNVDLSAYYTSPWNSTDQANGDQINAALMAGTGSTGTGITFSDPGGELVPVRPMNTVSITGLSIALNANAKVNSLINNFFGTADLVEATVTFTNSNSQTATYSLVGDQTTRDYNNYIYTNDLSGSNSTPGLGAVTAQEWWNNGDGGQRLDVQTFVLPSSWAGSDLSTVTIVDPTTGDWDVLSALRVDEGTPATTPEPGSLALLAIGLVTLCGIGISRRKLALS
jgi:PEP-CTERM motif